MSQSRYKIQWQPKGTSEIDYVKFMMPTQRECFCKDYNSLSINLCRIRNSQNIWMEDKSKDPEETLHLIFWATIFVLISVTRRSRSDVRQSVSQSVSDSVSQGQVETLLM